MYCVFCQRDIKQYESMVVIEDAARTRHGFDRGTREPEMAHETCYRQAKDRYAEG